MKITAKQAKVLDNLHRIVMRRVGGRLEPFLDGQSCKIQLNSLGAKRLVDFDASGRPTRVARPVDLTIVQYRRGAAGRDQAGSQPPAAAPQADEDACPTP